MRFARFAMFSFPPTPLLLPNPKRRTNPIPIGCNYLQFKVTNTGTSTTIAYAGLAATGDIIVHASQPRVVALGSVAGSGVA